jgi:hypothetical protein
MEADVEVVLGLENTVVVLDVGLLLAALPALLEVELWLVIDGIVSAVKVVHLILDHLHLF